MSRHLNNVLTVRGPMVALSICCLWTLRCAGEEVSIQVPDERAPVIRYDIAHATKILPVPNSELFQLPEGGIRTDTRSALARNGDIYVGGGGFLWKSTDRGETWTKRDLPQRANGGFGIIDDDVFVLVLYSSDNHHGSVLRSTDYGETWSDPAPLDIGPYNYCGRGWSDVYQHPDGTAMITMTLRKRDPGNRFHDYIYRSRDAGKTWGDPTLLIPYSAESSLLALRGSGRMLAFIRAQRVPLADDADDFWKQTGAGRNNPWPLKNGVVAESEDGGRTWHNLRLFDTYGSVPGEMIETPDGRVAAIWLQRYPYHEAEIRARISTDGGRTWEKRTYRVLQGHGYPSSIVYPDGTIVTVCENTKLLGGEPAGKRTMAAVRWQLPKSKP